MWVVQPQGSCQEPSWWLVTAVEQQCHFWCEQVQALLKCAVVFANLLCLGALCHCGAGLKSQRHQQWCEQE